MPRKFIGRKEMAFVNAITKELIQNVVGQEITYFQVMAEKTKTNDLYNEAIDKVYAVPVRVNCLVYYENSTETVSNFPADSKFNVDVHFHNAELAERKLEPKMGDFVQFGEVVYEVYTVTRPQIAFGQIDQKVMTKCTCGPARRGQFGLPRQPSPTLRDDKNAPDYSMQSRDVKLKGDRR